MHGVGRSERVVEERKTVEEALIQNVVHKMENYREIFMDSKTFSLVLGIIIEMKSSHSLFLILMVLSCMMSAKKLVCTMGGILLPYQQCQDGHHCTSHIPCKKNMVICLLWIRTLTRTLALFQMLRCPCFAQSCPTSTSPPGWTPSSSNVVNIIIFA